GPGFAIGPDMEADKTKDWRDEDQLPDWAKVAPWIVGEGSNPPLITRARGAGQHYREVEWKDYYDKTDFDDDGAIRDGFFAAFYRAAMPRPALRVYDTGATPDSLIAAYREALDDGAEFIVGPLKREDVAALAESGRQPVPVLALNYLDANRAAPFNFFQWGLAPEDEARQAAERAVTERQFRAVMLAPDSEWGGRVAGAFRERLESLGGKVVAARTYSSDSRDHSETIRALLLLDQSEERHRALTTTLGVKSEFEPRRRSDVDLVFIAARPDHAQLLGPQLRFHRAGDLPTYATSLIYDGDAPAADLNGLRFCDMPWMLAQDGELAALRSQLRTLFPGRGRDYTRLLALGYDAYTLAALLDKGQLSPGSYFPGGSGTLSLRADGVITRGLSCAQIRNGVVKPLDVSLAP
ncbi:MAG: penicillin-binding protein activator, partial [Hydrocarboniphaga effusa]|nr:penicillin-binding protein activator [Hydrocarboniphaga effusa]